MMEETQREDDMKTKMEEKIITEKEEKTICTGYVIDEVTTEKGETSTCNHRLQWSHAFIDHHFIRAILKCLGLEEYCSTSRSSILTKDIVATVSCDDSGPTSGGYDNGGVSTSLPADTATDPPSWPYTIEGILRVFRKKPSKPVISSGRDPQIH